MADTRQEAEGKRRPAASTGAGDAVKAPETAASSDPLELLRQAHPEHHDTPASVFKQLGITALIAGVVLGGYLWYTRGEHAAKMLMAEALPLVEKGDVASLREAEAKYKDALDQRGDTSKALGGLAEVYGILWVEHGFEDAKDPAHEYAQKAVNEKVETSQRYVGETLVLLGDGKFADAERVVNEVVARGGMSDRLYWVRGVTELAEGKVSTAVEKLKRAVDMKPNAPHYALAYGDALEDNGETREAADAWDKAAKANPSYVPGVTRDAYARIKRGEDRKALLAEVTRVSTLPATELGPKDLAAIAYTRAAVAFQEGKNKEAVKLVDSAVKQGGALPRYLLLRGQSLIADGKTSEGLKTLLEAHKKVPGADRYLYGLVDAYLDAGKADDAVKAMLGAADGRADKAPYHVKLGEVYVAKGDFAKAKASLDKALSLQPDDADAYLGQGISAWKQKQFADALPFFEKAVTQKPKFPEVYEAIGLMFVEQGALDQGNTQLDMGEKLFRATDAETSRLVRYYQRVIKTFNGAKKATSFVKDWTAREKAFRDGTQAPLP